MFQNKTKSALVMENKRKKKEKDFLKRPNSPPPNTARATRSSTGEIVVNSFDYMGAILSHAVPRSQIVN